MPAPYPALDANLYGPGAPIDITDQNKLWGGTDKTNGFLMRSVDGRVPALAESFAKAVIAAASPLNTDGVIPWGNALWIDIANIDTQPHTVNAVKPAAAMFAGVLKFEQGVQTGNPVQPFGIPPWTRGTVIKSGYVGYKVSMTAVGQEANYMAYLKGDASQDIAGTRQTYEDWVATYKAGADGDRLGLFFGNASGFPIVSLVAAASVSAPTLANATFAGFAEAWEPENQAIYFKVRG
jgi:hypothetical protein